MTITGYLSEFSLPELLKFLQEGRKSGLLTIISTNTEEEEEKHYLWLHLGRVVAAAHDLDNLGLIKMIEHKGLINTNDTSIACPLDSLAKPMGVCLKSQNLLNIEQLKLLFYIQVMQEMCALFKLEDGWFKFDTKASLPMSEMTGLSTGGQEATLSALRALRDWSMLKEKLPEPTSGLFNTAKGKPDINLNHLERKVWVFANGTTSLNQIAKQLEITLEKVQQIAFRLIIVGLVDEIPMVEAIGNFTIEPKLTNVTNVNANNHGNAHKDNPQANEIKATNVSQSFLENLMGFLRTRAT